MATPAIWTDMNMAAVAIVLLALGGIANDCQSLARAYDKSEGANNEDTAASALGIGNGVATLYSIYARANAALIEGRRYTYFTDFDGQPVIEYEVGLILKLVGVVELFVLLAGYETPYAGADIKAGQDLLDLLYHKLGQAYPDFNQWDSPAAEIYAQNIGKLQSLVGNHDTTALGVNKNLCKGDQRLADGAKFQGDLVAATRLMLQVLISLLLLADAAVRNLDLTNPVQARTYESTVAYLGSAALVAILGAITAVEGFDVCLMQADPANASYTYVRDARLTRGGSGPDGLPPATGMPVAETRVAGFEAIVADMSAMSAPKNTRSLAAQMAALPVRPGQPSVYADHGLRQTNQMSGPASRPAHMTRRGRQANTLTKPAASKETTYAEAAWANRTQSAAGVLRAAAERVPNGLAPANFEQEGSTWKS